MLRYIIYTTPCESMYSKINKISIFILECDLGRKFFGRGSPLKNIVILISYRRVLICKNPSDLAFFTVEFLAYLTLIFNVAYFLYGSVFFFHESLACLTALL